MRGLLVEMKTRRDLFLGYFSLSLEKKRRAVLRETKRTSRRGRRATTTRVLCHVRVRVGHKVVVYIPSAQYSGSQGGSSLPVRATSAHHFSTPLSLSHSPRLFRHPSICISITAISSPLSSSFLSLSLVRSLARSPMQAIAHFRIFSSLSDLSSSSRVTFDTSCRLATKKTTLAQIVHLNSASSCLRYRTRRTKARLILRGPEPTMNCDPTKFAEAKRKFPFPTGIHRVVRDGERVLHDPGCYYTPVIPIDPLCINAAGFPQAADSKSKQELDRGSISPAKFHATFAASWSA